MTRILVLGASGMLGNAVLRVFAESPGFEAWGTVRSARSSALLPAAVQDRLIGGIEVTDPDSLLRAVAAARPDAVINCIGLVKQLAAANDPLEALPINAILPHRLARICAATGARLVHLSTDCVFSGARGMYRESDFADADDLYGRSKFLGETAAPHTITLRTSIIGHELDGARSLVGWFLAQPGPVRGFARAIFSGLPTVEVARVIRDHVLPRPDLAGLYHLSAAPISKYDLLRLIAERYAKAIEIERDDAFTIDRSLDSSRFRDATGFTPQPWPDLVAAMASFR